jgi:UDP-N-acetylmuramoyl-L-alanyl-D-glutamate--2,6-diaminopimelate ligase
VASDNRECTPGSLFVALPGARSHGASFAADAVKRGAVAILTDQAGADLIAAERLAAERLAAGGFGRGSEVPVLVDEDPRAHLGPIAAAVYGQPAEQLTSFAITGTNGKTTTAFMLDALMRARGVTPGLIGTVLMRSGDRVLASKLTTPEAADLQALFAAMVEDGVTGLAMEVSSHALALHRVDGITFDVAGFTNLTQDHLDFHKTMDGYFEAKKILFTPEHSRRGVIMIDDEWGVKLAAEATVPVVTIKTDPAVSDGANTGDAEKPDETSAADWTITEVTHYPAGSDFTLVHRDGRTLPTSTSLPGDFNVSNAALALVMTLESGVSVEELAAALKETGGVTAVVPGRMEVIEPGNDTTPCVIVDFAHNTEALALALDALREATTGRLICAFGSAGDRDAGKRPAMGAAAVQRADVVIITDDDPHSEDPAVIRAAVLAGAQEALDGVPGTGRESGVELHEIADRREAIRWAVAQAKPGDTVLIAGRGHETVQEVAGVNNALDDRDEVRAAISLRARDTGN